MRSLLSFLRKIILTPQNFSRVSMILASIALLLTPFVTCDGFLEPYTQMKWVIVLTSLICLFFVCVYSSPRLLFPRLPKLALYGIGGLFVTLIFNSFYHAVPLYTYENVRRLIFWGAAWCFFTFFFQTKDKYFPLIAKAISVTLGLFVTLALVSYALDSSSPPFLPFGNENIAAEAILTLLVFPLALLTRKWGNGGKSVLLNILTAETIAYLYLSCCRSVYMELFLIFLLIMWTNTHSFKEVLKILALSIVFLLLIFYLPTLLTYLTFSLVPTQHPAPLNILETILSKDVSFRWLLYLDTLSLILNTPLGVGVGQFEFASLPYFANLFPGHNESVIFLTPHSEFLHYLAEDGVVVSLLILGIYAYLLYALRKEITSILRHHPEFSFLAIIFFGEALVQFPLVAPIPYLIATLMLGRFCALLKSPPLTYPFSVSLKLILSGFALLVFGVLEIHHISQYIAYSYPDHEALNKKACSNLTRNWSACLNLASLYLDREDLNQAEAYASKALKWQPLNYHGLSLLGFTYLYQGKKAKACELFKKYDSFFQNQSSLHEVIVEECPPLS